MISIHHTIGMMVLNRYRAGVRGNVRRKCIGVSEPYQSPCGEMYDAMIDDRQRERDGWRLR